MRIISANVKGNAKDLTKIIQDNPADVILLQEVTMKEEDTLALLAEKTGFTHHEFIECFDLSKDYGKGILQEEPEKEGLGILSKIPFTTKRIALTMTKGLDRWPRICALHDLAGIRLCNLHLSKHKISRDKEVKELPEADLYIGDFNMFPEEFLKHFGKYENTYSSKKYTSFPEKGETLDYAASTRKIKDFYIIENNTSDHSFLCIEI